MRPLTGMVSVTTVRAGSGGITGIHTQTFKGSLHQSRDDKTGIGTQRPCPNDILGHRLLVASLQLSEMQPGRWKYMGTCYHVTQKAGAAACCGERIRFPLQHQGL